MNVNEFILDLSKEPAQQPALYIGQGDKNGTTLAVSLYDNGAALDLTDMSVKFCMRCPGNTDYYEVSGEADGNVATFLIDETYAASHVGETSIAYVQISDGDDETVSTARFHVIVLESAQEGAEIAPAYASLIEEFLEDAQEEVDEAVAAAQAIVDYQVPTMSATMKGGAKLGSGFIMSNETLSVDPSTIELPIMSASQSGVAMLGDGLAIDDGVLSVDPTTTADIDDIVDDQTVTGDESLSTSGLAYFWSKLKTWAAATYAALSHSHAASDITSGTLPVTNGGTGLTSSPSMLTNLASTTAADVLAASPRPGVTGTLPIANGGTGAGTAADARTSLEITPSNIGAAASSHTHDASDISGGKLVIGEHSLPDTSNDDAFIIGNGTSGAQSDALTVAWDGSVSSYSKSLDRDGDTPSSNVSYGGYTIYDKDGEPFAKLGAWKRTTGYNDVMLLAYAENSLGTEIYHQLDLRIKPDGTREVYVTDKNAWLAALGLTVELTTTASEIATAASGFTINSAAYTSYGNVATVRLSIKTANGIGSGNITNTTVATMKSGKRPNQITPISTMSDGPVVVGYINGNGGVVITATHSAISANESFEVGGTFILA